ncbi:MAG: decaprenyl-phosphate phosphoribosyltransferase [Sedimentisphaerales bacterium]
MTIKPIIELARPGHWIKNIIVFLPIIFSRRLDDPAAWQQAFVAAIVFCMASSFAYIINDINDRQADQSHPLKKNRPLVSGRITTATAVMEAAVFLVLAIIVAYGFSKPLLLTVATYMLLQVSYSLFLKQKVLVDVICIALGFVLRAFSGVVAIRGEISPWLFICIFTICLFMGFCKRYSEIATITCAVGAKNHRPTLMAYSHELLTHLITLSAGIAVISFLLYSLSESTVARFGNNYFVYTLPIVIYAVFRFAMLSMKGSYADPTDLILHDRPFQLIIGIWTIAAFGIIYWGGFVDGWMKNLYYP